jgi:hypothetical protein
MDLFKQKRIFLIIILSWFLGNSYLSNAQNEARGPEIFLSPRITLGYTFGSGLNYGIDAVVGLYKTNDFKFGINFTYNMTNTDQGHHAIKGMGIVAEMKYFSLKLGAGSVSRRWGLKNINKASAPGLTIDVALSIGEANAPWVGVKSFIFDHERWAFYDHPSYLSAYTYFKSPDIMIFEEKSVTGGTQ